MTAERQRRRLILGLTGLFFTGPALAARLLQPTPRQSAGPFYPLKLPSDDDNDLTRIDGRNGVAQGRSTDLYGRLLDVNGRALSNVRIEIWQCDANGRYRHPRDRGGSAIDPNFQGHGHAITDAKGGYRFRTIRPVPYPGRTPHIHMAVLPADGPPFVTQLYIKGEPLNTQDFLFNRIPVERRHLVVSEFAVSSETGAELTAHFDIVLGGADGTPSA